MPESDFLKQWIALIANAGGLVSLSLADLQQLGVEVTLQSLGSSAPTLVFRLGAKIYYVPAKESVEWPTTQSTSPDLTSELQAVNNLNNHLNRTTSLEPLPALIDSDNLPQHSPLHKSDIDLFLAEQKQSTTKARRDERERQAIRNKSRPLPWEIRKTQ